MSIKLTYFNGKGVAEFTRYILAFAGQEFKDERVQREDWPAMKEKTPLGMMPILTLENGKQYAESVAIARYFAEKFDLAGKTAEEKLHSNMVVEVFRTDIVPALVKVLLAKEEEKEALKAEAQTKVDGLLKNVDKHYVEGEGTFLGSGFSWADIALYNLVDDLFPATGIIFDDGLAKLIAIRDKVRAEPKIAKWVTERPVTPM